MANSSWLCRLRVFLIGAAALITTCAFAADPSGQFNPEQVRPWAYEFGLRYWYSTGESVGDLYDSTGATSISRLTYDGLDAHSGEAFFRVDHNPTRLFLKGYIGGGVITGGSLRDEDFPPFVDPYSDTLSPLEDGDLAYLNLDFGYTFYQMPSPAMRPSGVGAFMGYHYWHERLHAFGCQQRATSAICVPTIPTSTAVISQENNWHSLRLGLNGDAQLSERLRLSAEAAFVYTWLDAVDNHHLRPAINPLYQDGNGPGFQVEAVFSYDITNSFSIGLGGRYWRLGKTYGTAHFEQTSGGGIPQVMDWEAERYGAFVQGSVRF